MSKKTEFILIYVTNSSEEEARKISLYLLNKKLIACANIFPISSLYWWEGKIADEKEFVSILKTASQNFETVKTEVEKIHPYKTPCIIQFPVSSNEKYFNWVMGELK